MGWLVSRAFTGAFGGAFRNKIAAFCDEFFEAGAGAAHVHTQVGVVDAHDSQIQLAAPGRWGARSVGGHHHLQGHGGAQVVEIADHLLGIRVRV